MTKNEVMAQLEKMGSEQIKKIYTRHGATGDFFGVRVGDMKTIVKKIKKDHDLAKELYATGMGDVMYFACLIADEKKVTKGELEQWVKQATWPWNVEYSVPWVAAESPYGWELALKWIDAKNPNVMTSGWGTLTSLIGITDNDKIDLKLIEKLMNRVVKEIHKAPNRVRYQMNGFLIAVGGGIPELTEKAIAAAKKIGKVEVDMQDTDCKVPDVVEYIAKLKKAGRYAKKKKMARC